MLNYTNLPNLSTPKISADNKIASSDSSIASSLGLSSDHITKNGDPYPSKNTKNPDYTTTTPSTEIPYYEYAEGGSWCRIAECNINPHTTRSEEIRDWIRGRITTFSRSSRKRLLRLVSKLDKIRIDPRCVLFITLTSPAPKESWMIDGRIWKKRLNTFLTRLRQKYKSTGMSGLWRLDWQPRRGAPHYHLILYGISYICKDWIAQAWNKMCSDGLNEVERVKHLEAGTSIELARNYKKLDGYISKTMAYIGKNEHWKIADQEILDWIQNADFGRHWGVICRDNLNDLIEIVVGQFENSNQFYKVRRIIRKYIQSARRQKLGNHYNIQVGKMLHRIFSQKRGCKVSAFIPDGVFRKVLSWAGLDNAITDMSQYCEI